MFPRTIGLFFILLLCFFTLNAADEVDADQVRALARNYFRDSTEIPMNVAVTTLLTDPAGKLKRQSQGTAGLVFNGYNQGAGKFSLHANAGMLNAGTMRDSVSGDLASFFAGGLITRLKVTQTMDIHPSPDPGTVAIVIVKDEKCPPIELMPRYMFPQHPCGAARFSLKASSHGGLRFQHFDFDSAGVAAPAKISGLGDVELQAFHAGVEFQEVERPGDKTPYLWPLEAVTSVITDKGKVTITNRYSPKN